MCNLQSLAILVVTLEVLITNNYRDTLTLKRLQNQSLSTYFVSITACCMLLSCCHYNYSKLCTGHLLLCSFNGNISISYCAAISCGYYHHSTMHTEWLDSTTTSQQWGPSEGACASPESWGQTRPSGQGEDRMGQCIECMQLRIGRWYVKHTVKPEAISPSHYHNKHLNPLGTMCTYTSTCVPTAHRDVHIYMHAVKQVPTELSYIAKQDCRVNPCLLSSNKSRPHLSTHITTWKRQEGYGSDREFWQGLPSVKLFLEWREQTVSSF